MKPGSAWRERGGNKAATAGTLWAWGLALIFLMGTLAFTGCGRKADPVVPRQVPLPRIQDLAGKVTGDTLTLTWTLPQVETGGASPVSVTLFQARTLTGDTVCPACQPAFKPVATVPVKTPGPSDRAMTWQLALDAGYRYRFKATVQTADGNAGEGSNWVVLDH